MTLTPVRAQHIGTLGGRVPDVGVRRLAHMKKGVIISCRLGDPLHAHALAIAGTRHDNLGGRMELTRLEVQLVELVPGVGRITDRLLELAPKAQRKAQEGLGRYELILDATRNHLAFQEMAKKLDISMGMLVTTHARKIPSTPYWSIGRMTLFSHLSVLLGRAGVMQFPAHRTENPNVWSPQQVRDALAAAQAKPPKEEPDALVVDTTTQDDVALAIAAAAMRAEDGAPDPWVGEPDYGRAA